MQGYKLEAKEGQGKNSRSKQFTRKALQHARPRIS